jgi:hypothetical protein
VKKKRRGKKEKERGKREKKESGLAAESIGAGSFSSPLSHCSSFSLLLSFGN